MPGAAAQGEHSFAVDTFVLEAAMVNLLTEPIVNRENYATDDEDGEDVVSASPLFPAAQLTDRVVGDLVLLFKLFADETRLRILVFLMQHGELNVRTLCQMLGQSQPAVSHHLALLRVNGLIECRRDGKHNFYRVLPERFEELAELIFRLGGDASGTIRFDEFALTRTAIDE
jgi:ArsR family transcriptional regulator